MPGQIFVSAVSHVLRVSTGCSFSLQPDESSPRFSALTGVVCLNGKNKGMLFISLEENVLRHLTSRFTGAPEEEINEADQADVLCEIVNMTAGNAKLQLNETDFYFSFAPPFVIKAQDMTIMIKNRVRLDSFTLSDGDREIK